MPVSISHIYNSCYRNVTAFGTGAGWKMNVQQTLHRETLEDADGTSTYYVYMDEDGTRHHFKSVSGEWKDQSGKGMTLTISGSTANMPLKRNMCFSIQQDKAFFCDEVTLTQKNRRFLDTGFCCIVTFFISDDGAHLHCAA